MIIKSNLVFALMFILPLSACGDDVPGCDDRSGLTEVNEIGQDNVDNLWESIFRAWILSNNDKTVAKLIEVVPMPNDAVVLCKDPKVKADPNKPGVGEAEKQCGLFREAMKKITYKITDIRIKKKDVDIKKISCIANFEINIPGYGEKSEPFEYEFQRTMDGKLHVDVFNLK